MDFRKAPPKIDTLMIFDLDGTLFRSETVTVPAVQSTFQKFDLTPPSTADIVSYFGKPHADFHEWLISITPSDISVNIIGEIDRRELDFVSTHGRLYDGVLEVLDFLVQSKIRLILCTNGQELYVSAVVDGYGLRARFNRIRYRKSSSDSKVTMVREIVRETEFRQGYLVGDRADDIEAAKKNSLTAIGAGYGFGSPNELIEADIVLADISVLPSVLDHDPNRSEARNTGAR